ncbi:MAG: hypothetical protein ACI9HK_000503 [Pirellulaceae bacterium]
MLLHCLDKIIAAARLKAANGSDPRTYEDLIAADSFDHQPARNAQDHRQESFHRWSPSLDFAVLALAAAVAMLKTILGGQVLTFAPLDEPDVPTTD